MNMGKDLTELFREELFRLYRELRHLDERIAHYDKKIKQIAQADERTQTIPGVGSMIATALLTATGDYAPSLRSPSRAANGGVTLEGVHMMVLSCAKASTTEEPDAGKPHVRDCAGGAG
ncbi:MAG: hypothetical protein OI74_01525 [Gammaproteobacteria bacterium (ex Lamellibrachia satsuma)]|nr:MAG: hypothetical protein HPY30_04980 [Gammaproteobacteria bacterium (ex Lamellibrachia satsuma)]RRS35626.1 MAG: hypothetical protein OI74_01525 [Gammaproteobacteria bacterium (ex Lamellibrachia satsuma)]RRS36233.1 MAG: hypothetical protein NV67_08080 [Gammaproteobacteria bacterium (ex Lamellibrachia satsuma)]